MIAERLIDWQLKHGRHDLPWQRTRDPYRVWLSEVMLQQTQVATVVPYYLRFVARFPDVRALAAAGLDEVLALWSGLGYYTRARNLHRCAAEVVGRHGGAFPGDAALLARLPGIGRSTAAAIAVFAFGRREAILDGNVRRVLCRHAGVSGYPGAAAIEKRLWDFAQAALPARGIEAYTQGLMDLGATVCLRARPACGACPLAGDCVALRDGTTAQLPAPRPRRSVPLRHCAMLVVRRGDEVLLERRPPAGVWGGLWSLPEAALADPGADPAPAAELARRFGLRVTPPRPLPAFDHAFTHFRLRVQPFVCELEAAAGAAQSSAALWLPLGETGQAALPQPVRALLRALPSRPARAGAGAAQERAASRVASARCRTSTCSMRRKRRASSSTQ